MPKQIISKSLQVTEHNTLKDDLEINFCSKLSFEFFTNTFF